MNEFSIESNDSCASHEYENIIIYSAEQGSDIQKQPDKMLLNRLKESRIGRIYLNYFKRFAAARQFSEWGWRFFYPYFVRIRIFSSSQIANFKWYDLRSIDEYSSTLSDAKKTSLYPPELLLTPKPRVTPPHREKTLVSPHEEYVFPEIYAVALSDAVVAGGTNLVVHDNKRVIHHNLINFSHDYTSEELHGRVIIQPAKKKICWMIKEPDSITLPVGASFVDACARNYAHWLTEILPRIAVFCAHNSFKDIPIIINNGLHENIIESLKMIVGAERQIIMLDDLRSLKVKQLHLVSSVGYVPFERRNNRLKGHSHGRFSPQSLSILKDRIYKAMPQNATAYPEKIYIRRNSGIRKLINNAQIEEFIVGLGYTIIEPEKLGFAEQVALFSHAKYIVASSGAAVANIILAPSETKITLLIAEHKHTSYWYWQNMALATGKSINYVIGVPDHGGSAGIHSDFYVDMQDLKESLDFHHEQ